MIGEIISEILRIKLASFLNKKFRYVWERLRASFLDRKSNVNNTYSSADFLKKTNFGNVSERHLWTKKQNRFGKKV